ncbi:hypothetical protein [Variovorax sp. GT1P44]|uniref:hypothetical protein n=1 Tax=Variovorax sp. GT1P44 TaxID=3443742 RepID=UPI003F47198F
MNNTFNKLLVLPIAALFVAGIALTPDAMARPGGGGMGGGGGGGARAGGGGMHAGGGGANRQVNNVNRDVRANNVRNTSVNNINANVNRNVNVNVNNTRGGWDNDYHPVATAAAITAGVAVTAAVVGSMVNTVPAGCVPVNYGGLIYQQCGTVWYQPQGSQYVVVNQPY